MKWLRVAVLACFAAQPMPGSGEELGRLFFTPAERRALDEGRRDAARGAAEVAAPMRIDGVVLRSNRRGTVWIDGAAREVRVDPGGPQASGVGGVALHAGKGQRIDARVGGTIDSAAGTARDLLEGGAIARRRR